jgi:hypothetical protein
VGDGDALVSFFVVSEVDDFLVVPEVDEVDDFLVVDVLAGDFSGAVVVAVSVLLVLQEARSPAANATVMQ